MAEGYRFTHPRVARLRNCVLAAACASLSQLDGRMDSCVAGIGDEPRARPIFDRQLGQVTPSSISWHGNRKYSHTA